MQRTLAVHISQLEEKIESLRAKLAREEGSPEFIKGLKLHLEIAETSLALFRKAYELEQTNID